jgi:L-rhamnose mutarotase
MSHRLVRLYCAAAFSFCWISFELLSGAAMGEQRAGEGRQTWTRRAAQIAEVSPEKLRDFQKGVQESRKRTSELLAKYHVRNESVFVKELTGGKPCAFRFYEYAGTDLNGDLKRLTADPEYQERIKAIDACLSGPWVDVEEAFYWAGQTESAVPESSVKIFGQVVGLRPEMIDSYKLLHAHAWPEVLSMISQGNMRNYSIYIGHVGEQTYLFAYFEYVGTKYDADMAMIDADKATQAWTKFTDKTCQLPIPTRKTGEWWADMDTVSILRTGK